MQPLKGIAGVTLEHAIAAPFATGQLADRGARVIKIERPGVGDFARGYGERVRGLASHFVWTHRSKECLTLDVKHYEAQNIQMRLILEEADVVVKTWHPAQRRALGLSHDALCKLKPGIIVCDISGYSIADIAAGMYACTNILAALMHRQQTGQGQRIDVSMLESLSEWMGYPLYYAFDGAPPLARTEASHATIYPYCPFLAGDGKTVMLGLQNEREWKIFFDKMLDNPALATDARFSTTAKRSAPQGDLAALIVAAFSTLTADEVAQRLEQAGIANAQVNTMAEVWAHPQLKARDRWREVDTPAGPIPALGQQGYSAERFAPLRAEGVV